MPVPFCQGWQHYEFQITTELSNSGVECLKEGRDALLLSRNGRFAVEACRAYEVVSMDAYHHGQGWLLAEL